MVPHHLQPFWLPLDFECLRDGFWLWVLQLFCHIQSIIIKVSTTVSLKWYDLPPYPITSQMKEPLYIFLTRTRIKSFNFLLTDSFPRRNLHLKLSLLTYSFYSFTFMFSHFFIIRVSWKVTYLFMINFILQVSPSITCNSSHLQNNQ